MSAHSIVLSLCSDFVTAVLYGRLAARDTVVTHAAEQAYMRSCDANALHLPANNVMLRRII